MEGGKVLKLSYILLVVVLTCFSPSFSKRPRRQGDGGQLQDWQKRYLEKIQLLGREGGLSEEEWRGITKYDKEVCYEKECLESALEIMTSTNFTADPCNPDKWLNFVCARRVNGPDNINQLERLTLQVQQETRAILNAKESRRDAKEFLLKEAQTYYYQCTHKALNDRQDVKDILSHLSEKYGDWPMMTNRDPGDEFNWLDMVADMNRIEKPGYAPLLLQVTVPNSMTGIKVDIGQTSIPITQVDFDVMMARVQKAAETNKPYRKEQLKGAVQFMNSVTYATMVKPGFAVLPISELQAKTDEHFAKKKITHFQVNWLEFFQRVLNGSEIDVTESSPSISLPFNQVMTMMKLVDNFLASNDSRSVSNALNFHLVSTLLQESTTYLDDLNSFRCREQTGSREAICFARTTDIFAYSLGKTYLNRYYKEKRDTPAIEEMMANIQQGYKNAIEETDWMADSTKEFLKDKIDSMKTFIAEPDWTKDPKQLRKFYRALHASKDKNSSYPLNFLNVTGWALMKKYKHAYDASQWTSLKDIEFYDIEWSRYLGTVNAQYHKALNDARIEGGIVRSPIFAVGRPGFMNYGGLGMVLAHEIGHSYDVQGRRYNKDGELGEWWDPESVKHYEEWVKTILHDAGDEVYQTSDTSAETTQAERTINEDISDALGVLMSFKSYEEYLQKLESQGKKEKVLPGLKKYKPQKLFFMKYANMWCNKKDVQDNYNDLFGVHSPGNTRATLPLKRSKEFADTFGCEERSQTI